ncbi:MAG: HlyD family efflux transporter periplasmic adaptor subunit [Opitutaceae bacterium]|nr:HlyD family efflux transporter periplasmic adaptor subunit [Opitutaceae bacterium]
MKTDPPPTSPVSPPQPEVFAPSQSPAPAAAPAGPQAEANFWLKPALKKKLLVGGIVVALAVGGGLVWRALQPTGPGAGFVVGNGRIEATEIDIATKLAGRVQDILVNEGDFVVVGQSLAQMQIEVLDAQRDEAQAQSRKAVNAVASAQAQVVASQSQTAAAQAVVELRESELDAAQRRQVRTETLTGQGVLAVQDLDDGRARVSGGAAALAGAQAQVAAAQAATVAAQAQVVGAGSSVEAAEATIARIDADIQDSLLKSPRAGRVQYRIAQPGEVLGAGGKVLNLVDLGDVYMTFFLPETVVGKVALGSEVHIVLDAALQWVIPAKVSYVASTAQFTPKTVETASERQKLMFRVKAQIDRALLEKHLKLVKTGLPGVAWLKLDAQATWPAELAIKVPQ